MTFNRLMQPAILTCQLLGAVAVLSALTGCNVIAGAAALMPKPPVPAQYEIEDKATLVLVEDKAGVVRDPSVVRQITASIQSALAKNEAITVEFVDVSRVDALRTTLGSEFERTSLGAIGRELGASQVIYVDITGFQLQTGGGLFEPKIWMSVRLIDIDAGKRVFPPDRDENGIQSSQSAYAMLSGLSTSTHSAQGGAARTIAARDLSSQAGLDVARLFFEWKRPEPGENLGPPQRGPIR